MVIDWYIVMYRDINVNILLSLMLDFEVDI